jgi:hypothetical protein
LLRAASFEPSFCGSRINAERDIKLNREFVAGSWPSANVDTPNIPHHQFDSKGKTVGRSYSAQRFWSFEPSDVSSRQRVNYLEIRFEQQPKSVIDAERRDRDVKPEATTYPVCGAAPV